MQALEHPVEVDKDFLPLNGTDHVEFYVGNARQAAYYYRAAFGFRLAAYRGPETGTRECASYVLVQNKIRLVFTTPLSPEHPAAGHVGLHGDGVRDVALWVDDAESAWRETTRRGARREEEENTSLVAEVPKAFDFQFAGEEVVNGRPAWVLQAAPHPGYRARGA